MNIIIFFSFLKTAMDHSTDPLNAPMYLTQNVVLLVALGIVAAVFDKSFDGAHVARFAHTRSIVSWMTRARLCRPYRGALKQRPGPADA